MKKTLLILMISAVGAAKSQTILYQENFESGGGSVTLNTSDMGGSPGGDNPWVINNIYAGGSGTFFCPAIGFNVPFTVPAAPTQPGAITGSPNSYYLHVTPQIAITAGGNLPAASYVAADGLCIFGSYSNFVKMNSDISTVGYDSVSFNFWWMCGGSTLYYGELYYSTNGGSTWTAVNCPVTGNSQWRGQTNWVNTAVTNAAWGNKPTLRFGYRFITASSTTGSELDPGFALDQVKVTGFVLCSATTSSISQTACLSYTVPSGDETYTSSGSYTDTIPNAGGCDSVISINLTINNVNTAVTNNSPTLVANASGAGYVWVDCDNNYTPISGATSQSYVATANGSYAVIVTQNSCVDTSVCQTVNNVGLQDIGLENNMVLYPNPTDGKIHVQFDAVLTDVKVEVRNELGQIVHSQKAGTTNQFEWDMNLPSGIYTLYIHSEHGVKTLKVIRK